MKSNYALRGEVKKRKQKDEYEANPEPKKMRERERYQANPEPKKTRERERYEANPEPKKQTMKLYWGDNKQHINPDRQKDYSEGKKADFSTTVAEMPLDTTDYEHLDNPETAVINWYMNSSDGWRYEWDMEGYLKNVESSDEGERLYAQSCLESLLHTLSLQEVTPEKQKQLGSEFYEAIGRGCDWGRKVNYNDADYGDSKDAYLRACACCGFREYDIDNAYRTYDTVPLLDLEMLKLKGEEAIGYEEKMKVEVRLPINEDGKMAVFYPWNCKSIYVLGENEEKCYYFLHPELVREHKNEKGCYEYSDAIVCNECMASIKAGEKPERSLLKVLILDLITE